MPAFPKPTATETDPVASPVASSAAAAASAAQATADAAASAASSAQGTANGAASAAAGAVVLAGTMVPKSTVTAKGDTIAATGNAAVTRVGVGSDGQVLTADAASAGGVKWTTPSSGGASLSAANSWSASQTFDGSSSTDAAIFGGRGALTAQKFALTNRVGATPGDFTFPIPTIRPIGTKVCALDVMPGGNPTQDASNGKAWMDVCNADVLASTSGAVGVARVAAFTDHVEYGSHVYNGASNLDVWIAANNTGSSVPQICINATTGLVSIYSKTQRTNTMLTVVTPASSYVPLAASGVTSQSADLFVAELTLNGTVGFSINNTGVPKWGNSNGQKTVGAAGAATELPAQPSRYLKVVGDNGTSYVIPAYLPS